MKPLGNSVAEERGTAANVTTSKKFDVERVRRDFPILQTRVGGRPLAYLDSGATTQKPQAVIDRVAEYYASENANIHRGVYALSQRATEEYEQARKKVQRFINAPEAAECLFTRGTTEGINLVANTWARANLKAGDEVVISSMEHHSNIVPWQMVCQQTGATLRVIPMNDAGELRMDEYRKMLSPRTKVVAVVHVSNSLGTVNDVREIARLAHCVGARVLVDGAQWVAHAPTDVQAIGCDFYAFSGHKLFGPTGIGVLWGKRELLDAMPPWQGGGDMIESVSFAKTTYAGIPNKFEAGTPNIAGAVGLGAAVDYVQSLGFAYADHEHDLLDYATKRMKEVGGLRVIGQAANKASVISFVMEDPVVSVMDLGTQLDALNVAVRTGHHCCQPVMEACGIPGTARASLAMYNTRADVDALVEGLKQIRERVIGSKSASVAAAKKADDGAMDFPGASAPSPQAAADVLAEDFDLLGDREAKNQYVLEMGDKLPRTFDLLKRVTQRVPGCMSEVYVVPRKGANNTVEFIADANADIVRGLIAILQRLYSGQRSADILAFDIEAFFHRIGLDQFISSQRRNGLAGMVGKIREYAKQVAH
jgi:cysteine desulfurase/selenocysteine lyase